MSERLDELKERMAQLSDLRHVSALAHWDQQTMMPPRGGAGRAESLATLERISHELFVDDETGRLLDGAAAELNGADPDSDDACLVRLVRRQLGEGAAGSDRAGGRARPGGVGGPGGLGGGARGRLTSPPSRRIWSTTSSSPGATSSVTPASTATSAPTTWCSTTTSRR